MAVDLYRNTLTGDIDISNGVITLNRDKSISALQQCTLDLNMFRGLWFANTLAGVPYLKNSENTIQILGKVSKEVYDSYIRESILGREFVTRIVSYESVLNKQTRVITVTCEAKVETGEVVRFTI